MIPESRNSGYLYYGKPQPVKVKTIYMYMYMSGLLVGRGKKSNFTGFSGTNSRKKRPISREFRENFAGIFEASFAEKQLVKNGQYRESFLSKFCRKVIDFVLI